MAVKARLVWFFWKNRGMRFDLVSVYDELGINVRLVIHIY